MPSIPPLVASEPISGLKLLYQGKVRDSYELPDRRFMLVVASDRCSIFDFVLNTLIPEKGEVLTALNYFWVMKVIEGLYPHDLVACGSKIDEYLPAALRGNVELQKRATVVRCLVKPIFEDIVRCYLTGSVLKAYGATGEVAGQRLPPGLTDGAQLPYPLYTPSTKADKGHDVNLTADEVVARAGFQRERWALQIAKLIGDYAASRGIIFVDTKFEFSQNGNDLILVDEKGTPDSSRFWDHAAWIKAQAAGQLPPSFDKQYVREWGKAVGLDPGKLNPQNDEDVAWVQSLLVPEKVVTQTNQLYRYIFWRLTGMRLERFQREKMGIDLPYKGRQIEILVGSESDLWQIEDGLEIFRPGTMFRVSVLSCHRNCDELSLFLRDGLKNPDRIIAGAGMAAALPGIVKSLLCASGRSDIPVIGVAFQGTTEKANVAARLSIEELPGQPVELEADGSAYFGPKGFRAACEAALQNEFLPKTVTPRPAQIGKIDYRGKRQKPIH